MKRSSSRVSRSHSVAATASTATDAPRSAGRLRTGTMSNRTAAVSSGSVQRYAAAGANHSMAIASASHTGSDTLHVTSGSRRPCARAGSQRPARLISPADGRADDHQQEEQPVRLRVPRVIDLA